MSEKEFKARIDKPVVHTTSKGASYVVPFDVVRSARGRAVISSHAKAIAVAKSNGQHNGGNQSKD